MAQIEVDQAVFASDNNARVRGYQLVARSAGIDDQVAHELCRWSPSHNGLHDEHPNTTGLCFFPVCDRVAIGQSVFGAPEYSGRGGLQIVTSYLVTSPQHLAAFGNDAWAMALMARSMGFLRFAPPFSTQLPKLPLSNSWSVGAAMVPPSADEPMANAAIEKLRQGRNVAVVGLDNATATLRLIISNLSMQERGETSFATNLTPSSQRPFRLQFLSQADLRLRADLSNQRIAIIKPAPTPAAAPEFAGIGEY